MEKYAQKTLNKARQILEQKQIEQIDSMKIDLIKINSALNLALKKESNKEQKIEIQEKAKKPPIIGIICPDFVADKHYGFLGAELMKRGALVLFLCSREGSLKRSQKVIFECEDRGVAVFCGYEFANFMDFCDCVCVSGAYKAQPKTTICHLNHGIREWDKFDFSRLKIDILPLPGPPFSPKEQKIAQFSKIDFVKSGYLGYDTLCKEYGLLDFNNGLLENSNIKRDKVLIVPHDMDELPLMIPFALEIAKEFKVLFRYRVGLDRPLENFIAPLLGVKNIEIESSNPMSYELYCSCFAMVCGITSGKHSFPLLCGCPVIGLPFKNMQNDVHGLVQDELGLRIEPQNYGKIGLEQKEYEQGGEQIKVLLREIQSQKEQWRQRILNFRRNKIYNFGRASEVLAEYLVGRFWIQ